MNIQSRITSLEKKHEQLETRLHMEEIRPSPDDLTLHQLKREKLALKDEIARMLK